MANIREKLGLRKVDGHVGIEIEVEGCSLPEGNDLWSCVADGSLRGESGEYVLKQPCKDTDIDKVLNNLKVHFAKNHSEVYDTYRAGVHVHLNVQDLTVNQLFNLVTLYYIFEECLVDFCAKSRRGNHFCLRAKDAEYIIRAMVAACEVGNLKALRTDDLRYSSLNITSLFKYGSVEFRSLETPKNFDRVGEWAKILNQLRLAAIKWENPLQVIGKFSDGELAGFVNGVFGDYDYVILNNPGWEAKVKEGVFNAQDIAYARSWGSVNLDIFSTIAEM